MQEKSGSCAKTSGRRPSDPEPDGQVRVLDRREHVHRDRSNCSPSRCRSRLRSGRWAWGRLRRGLALLRRVPRLDDEGGVPPEGKMMQHTLASPVIEVARDGKTAKGVWMSTGSRGPGAGRQAYGHLGLGYLRRKDFIKEDGEWKIRNHHVYVQIRHPVRRALDAERAEGPGEHLPPRISR